jgi:hypothetical protein
LSLVDARQVLATVSRTLPASEKAIIGAKSKFRAWLRCSSFEPAKQALDVGIGRISESVAQLEGPRKG